jgi:hypothetical protein
MTWKPVSEPPTVEGEYLIAYRKAYSDEWQLMIDTWSTVNDDGPLRWFGESDKTPPAEWWTELPEPPR